MICRLQLDVKHHRLEKDFDSRDGIREAYEFLAAITDAKSLKTSIRGIRPLGTATRMFFVVGSR